MDNKRIYRKNVSHNSKCGVIAGSGRYYGPKIKVEGTIIDENGFGTNRHN